MAVSNKVKTHKFVLNGKRVSVRCESDIRLLWVLRDLMGVNGPKYGCGIGACQACTSHLNGKAVNICCIPVGQLKATDKVLTIEGLAASTMVGGAFGCTTASQSIWRHRMAKGRSGDGE